MKLTLFFILIYFVLPINLSTLFGQSTSVPVKNEAIDINNIQYWFRTDGIGSLDTNDYHGMFWKENGELHKLCYSDGIIIGGKAKDQIKVTGSAYESSMIPGKAYEINNSNRVWKYRKDWQTIGNPTLKARILDDLKTWPVKLGAPFEDLDGDGKYDPDVDTPINLGDEVNWFLMHDMDSLNSVNYFGSKSIGIEIQMMTYAYNQGNFLDEVVFKNYKIINKSNDTIKETQVGLWADFDLIESSNDYVGCDSSLMLGFGYNSVKIDSLYSSIIVPSLGYQFLEGGKKNGINVNEVIKMSSFTSLIKGLLHFMHDAYEPIEWFNNISGKTTTLGERITDPITLLDTYYPYSGDPETGIGWLDGDQAPAYDRRLVINAGPISFLPNDTLNITYAIIAAQGIDHLNSVTELKKKAKLVRDFYYNNLSTTDVYEENIFPENYSLSQNYPNPFNPTTQIKYTLPKSGKVKIVVFDILGREVKILVNEFQDTGNYIIYIDGSSLSSGVYFYRLTSKDFTDVKKMLLMK